MVSGWGLEVREDLGNTHSSNLYSPHPVARASREAAQLATDCVGPVRQTRSISQYSYRPHPVARASREAAQLATDRVGHVRQTPSTCQYIVTVRQCGKKKTADIRKVQPHMNKNALPVPLPSQVFEGSRLDFRK